MKEIYSRELSIAHILEGLNQAIGASTLLIHHQQNTFWMRVRDFLELAKAGIISDSVDPMFKPKEKPNAEAPN